MSDVHKLVEEIKHRYPEIQKHELISALDSETNEGSILLYMCGQTDIGYQTFHITIDRRVDDAEFKEAKHTLLTSGVINTSYNDEQLSRVALIVLWDGLTNHTYDGNILDDPLINRCNTIISHVHQDSSVIVASAYTKETKLYVSYEKYSRVKRIH
jgi:hypothetical protein